jgi:hypothetical protein
LREQEEEANAIRIRREAERLVDELEAAWHSASPLLVGIGSPFGKTIATASVASLFDLLFGWIVFGWIV